MTGRRPWWLLVFALPLCCGASLLSFALGAGGTGILAAVLIRSGIEAPLAALGMGALFGTLLAVPLLAVATRRTHVHADGCCQ